jgi:O-antigen/teichoic acid export membrane protein
MVARHLGAQEFGQLTLAFALFYTFQVFAIGGLKTLIVRQVAKDREQTSAYFVHGSIIVGLSSVASLLILWGFVRLMHYPTATASIILLVSVGIFPSTLSAVCEGIFQAWEQMRYIAYVNVPVNLAKIGAAFVLLSSNRGLDSVVLALLVSLFLIAAIEVRIVLQRFSRKRVLFDFDFAVETVRSAVTFLGIDGTSAVMSSLNILLLSKFASEIEVGLYSSAAQVMVPLLLVYQSMAQSIFPVMCRKVQPGYQSLRQIAEQSMELLLILALPAACGLFFVGDLVLSVLYRNPVFVQAFPALRIIVWVLIFQVFTSVLGQALIATHRERVNLKIVITNTLFNLVIGWPLIRYFGLRGAAVALLLTKMADCYQHYMPVSRLFSGISLVKIVWKPVLAAAFMVGYLAMPLGRVSILAGVSATVVYAAVLLFLAIWACGGYRQFIEKYRPLLSE